MESRYTVIVFDKNITIVASMYEDFIERIGNILIIK
jgi:hypothetical protein